MSLGSWFQWVIGKVAEAPTKALSGVMKDATGASKDITGMTKDVTGIRKDVVETKLAEIKLEESKQLVKPATFGDVKEFDPKYNTIRKATRFLLLICSLIGVF